MKSVYKIGGMPKEEKEEQARQEAARLVREKEEKEEQARQESARLIREKEEKEEQARRVELKLADLNRQKAWKASSRSTKEQQENEDNISRELDNLPNGKDTQSTNPIHGNSELDIYKIEKSAVDLNAQINKKLLNDDSEIVQPKINMDNIVIAAVVVAVLFIAFKIFSSGGQKLVPDQSYSVNTPASVKAPASANTPADSASTQISQSPSILGHHKLSLQWISWDYFGDAEITKSASGEMWIQGEQKSKENSDKLSIYGSLEQISPTHLRFKGQILIEVSGIANSAPCMRYGDFNFKSTAGRKYWRLQEMDNPCDSVTDYVDIYF